MLLRQIITGICPLPEAPLRRLEAHFEEVTCPRGHILLRPDKVEHYLYFIRQGIARAYADQQEQEITFWFGTEGAPVLSMKSYVFRQPSYESVALIEDSMLYRIHIQALHRLFGEDIHLANWGRAFAEQELVKTEERLISRQFRSAEARYRELLQDFPELIRRVPLKHIASYLGITAVSLSRIRAAIT